MKIHFAKAGKPGVAEVPFGPSSSYRVPNPSGEWSYVNFSASVHTRIDHVVHTQAVRIETPRYVTHSCTRVLAGPTFLPNGGSPNYYRPDVREADQ